jgi:hypothetical protein
MKPTDPRRPGGSIAGFGGSYDENQTVVDVSKAVLLDACEVAIVGGVRHGVLDPKPITALLLAGRINKTEERAHILFLLDEDGAAAIVTELIGVAHRSGWGPEFLDRVKERMDRMPTAPPEGTP